MAKKTRKSGKPRGWDALVAACAAGLTVPKAAKAVGITDRTAYRHYKTAEFQKELSATRGRAVGLVATRAVEVALLGLGFLREVIRDDGADTAQRVKASLGAVDKVAKLFQVVDVLPELAELREAVERIEAHNGTK